eukprot:TRINITY_DN8877_c0_g1_i1.p1 TRINITY_DN8877_c0_g1~~TRINITY_DN8877_c0_g1_i1.p1  ORF type:complete len:1093 (+),score=360.10 TRINITY_DN8877_c0_g1_i1:50-3280(+)
MAITEEQAMTILDFKQDRVDIAVLDTLVTYLYEGQPGSQPQKLAEQILNEFQKAPEAWTRVHQILQESSSSMTKYLALSVLINVIKSQWKLLPEEQTKGMKDFIVEQIIALAGSFESLQQEKMYIGKLNAVLVQIVKQEWPQKWPSFVTDIVGASRTSESLCQNNLRIFQLLSEEIFDFSKGTIVQVKAQHLKDTLCDQFQPIFELCQFVMEKSEQVSLIEQTLATMLRFLSWIPIGYVFETDLVPTLVNKFLNVPVFRNATMQCLAEVAALPGDMKSTMDPATLENIQTKQISLFQLILSQLVEMLPPDSDIRSAWDASSMDEQAFIRYLSLFFTSWLKEHGQLLEQPTYTEALMQALGYLVMMSNIPDKEIFKICLEYWSALASSLFQEQSNFRGFNTSPLALGNQASPRRQLYAPVLSELRMIMVSNMAKPEEVLVVENDDGEVVREAFKDTDTIELYKSMRVTLVYLTHLDCNDMEAIMTEKLNRQINKVEYSWHNLNTLCWAVGSISGAMVVDDEKKFLVRVIRELLNLCEFQQGKSHKAVIASNIMYVVGQYPRFLRAHWKFLKTVVNKLFEFMHELHEGVQDMACDTFIKIAVKCKPMFVETQMGEVMPFVEEILNKMPITINELQPHQIHTFYEAVGHMISAQTNPETQANLIANMMSMCNRQWSQIMSQASNDVSIFANTDTLNTLINILKTNTSACRSIGDGFFSQLRVIYMDMLLLYTTLSEQIQQGITQGGPLPVLKAMKKCRREILRLVSAWVSKAKNAEQAMSTVIPPLMEAVLGSYQSSIPDARDHEVLNTFCTIVNSLRNFMNDKIMDVFAAVFESTLSMITSEFESNPEHRVSFYNLLHAIVSHCFDALAALQAEQWKMVIDAIVWGFQHPMRNVADTSLRIMKELLEKLQRDPNMAQQFYSTFYTDILQHLFSVATDSAHLSGINLHSSILAHLFEIAESGMIATPLDPSTPNNKDFVTQYVGELLSQAFPHLQPAQLEVIIKGFFAYDNNPAMFKSHLRDFLVQCKEAIGQDLDSLYLAERNEQLQTAQKEKMQRYAQIGGMLNPHENIDMADDNMA